MSITLTGAVLPVFKTGLSNLSYCLDKAAANAASRGFSADAFTSLKLAPDMLSFASQIRIACDTAKNSTARVSGLEAPRFADDETTFAQLQARIQSTLAWLETVPVDAFDGREASNITFPISRDKTRTLSGEDYLKYHSLPNFFFHFVTAYGLLRHAGVNIGKVDYLMGSGN
jgi:hypothetical protein